jgi:hypothetical protein
VVDLDCEQPLVFLEICLCLIKVRQTTKNIKSNKIMARQRQIQAFNVPRKKLSQVISLLIVTCFMISTKVCSAEMLWDHIVNLDENYQLLWKVREPDIVLEVQVRTLGYVGFGFSRDGTIYGADVFIGWIDNGHTFFHVSFSVASEIIFLI